MIALGCAFVSLLSLSCGRPGITPLEKFEHMQNFVLG